MMRLPRRFRRFSKERPCSGAIAWFLAIATVRAVQEKRRHPLTPIT